MIDMKPHFTGLAVAALIVIGSSLPGYAEDPAAPATVPAPAAAQPETPPASVPRPSLAPKAAAPVPAPVADEPPQRPHWRYAHHRWHRRGNYRTAYWEPFPIFWPNFYHHQLRWSRIPWRF
jgi:hypothetical protein